MSRWTVRELFRDSVTRFCIASLELDQLEHGRFILSWPDPIERCVTQFPVGIDRGSAD